MRPLILILLLAVCALAARSAAAGDWPWFALSILAALILSHRYNSID